MGANELLIIIGIQEEVNRLTAAGNVSFFMLCILPKYKIDVSLDNKTVECASMVRNNGDNMTKDCLLNDFSIFFLWFLKPTAVIFE